MRKPIVTLTTDFGLKDNYAASMKAVMLSINPEITFVDITHQVARHDIMEACFLLGNTYHYFPPWTVHVVVVDPTVGSKRRPIVASINNHYFVAPDNGVLSVLYQDPEDISVFEITAEHYYLKPLSSTFHGRDIFAPVAAWLTKGVELENFGEKIEDFVDLKLPAPKLVDETRLEGEIIHVDSFGNLISNIPRAQFDQMLEESKEHRFEVRIGDFVMKELKRYYAECQADKPSVLFGSTAQLEVCLKQRSAKDALGFDKGQKLTVQFL